MRIALVGGRDNQQFPTISYGGIATLKETLACAYPLSRYGCNTARIYLAALEKIVNHHDQK